MKVWLRVIPAGRFPSGRAAFRVVVKDDAGEFAGPLYDKATAYERMRAKWAEFVADGHEAVIVV